eukprot:1337200-Pyramimonas_sp.AAC.1
MWAPPPRPCPLRLLQRASPIYLEPSLAPWHLQRVGRGQKAPVLKEVEDGGKPRGGAEEDKEVEGRRGNRRKGLETYKWRRGKGGRGSVAKVAVGVYVFIFQRDHGRGASVGTLGLSESSQRAREIWTELTQM